MYTFDLRPFMIACSFALMAAGVTTACAPQASVGASAISNPPPGPSREGQITEGRRIAEMQCASCHAIGKAGESPVPIAPPFRTLAQRYPLNALEEAFAEGILVGHPMMPEFKFSPAQIAALLAYLNTIQDRRAG